MKTCSQRANIMPVIELYLTLLEAIISNSISQFTIKTILITSIFMLKDKKICVIYAEICAFPG